MDSIGARFKENLPKYLSKSVKPVPTEYQRLHDLTVSHSYGAWEIEDQDASQFGS